MAKQFYSEGEAAKRRPVRVPVRVGAEGLEPSLRETASCRCMADKLS